MELKLWILLCSAVQWSLDNFIASALAGGIAAHELNLVLFGSFFFLAGQLQASKYVQRIQKKQTESEGLFAHSANEALTDFSSNRLICPVFSDTE